MAKTRAKAEASARSKALLIKQRKMWEARKSSGRRWVPEDVFSQAISPYFTWKPGPIKELEILAPVSAMAKARPRVVLSTTQFSVFELGNGWMSRIESDRV